MWMGWGTCPMKWGTGEVLVCLVCFSLPDTWYSLWRIQLRPSSWQATRNPVLLPRSCLRFPGVLLLVNCDRGKLPPSLRRCRPWQLVSHRTSVVLLFVLGGMWLPIFLVGPVVIIDVSVLVCRWRRVLQLVKTSRKVWWFGRIGGEVGPWNCCCCSSLGHSPAFAIMRLTCCFPLVCVLWWSCNLACVVRISQCVD